MLILVVLRKCAIQEKIGIEFIEEHITGLDYSVNQLLTSDFDMITNENKKLFDELLSVTGMRYYYRWTIPYLLVKYLETKNPA